MIPILLVVFFIIMYMVIKRLLRAKKRTDRGNDIQGKIHDAIADNDAEELQDLLDEMEAFESLDPEGSSTGSQK